MVLHCLYGRQLLLSVVMQENRIYHSCEVLSLEFPISDHWDCCSLMKDLYNVMLLSVLGKYFNNGTSGFHSLLLEGTKSSFNLFNEILKQGTEENYDIRVMLVGRAAVGKTTLTRRLLRLPVNLKNYDCTNGVDVHIHSCDIQINSGTWGKDHCIIILKYIIASQKNQNH